MPVPSVWVWPRFRDPVRPGEGGGKEEEEGRWQPAGGQGHWWAGSPGTGFSPVLRAPAR